MSFRKQEYLSWFHLKFLIESFALKFIIALLILKSFLMIRLQRSLRLLNMKMDVFLKMKILFSLKFSKTNSKDGKQHN